MAFQIHGKDILGVRVQGETRNLLVLRGHGSTKLFDVHPLVEWINMELGSNMKVVSHKAAEAALALEETQLSWPAFPVDVAIAYEKPGARLGKEIVFSVAGEPSVALPTGRYAGELGIALAAIGLSPADIKWDGKSILLDIPESRLVAVHQFPDVDGWYLTHHETGVPQGEPVSSGPAPSSARIPGSARYLDRMDDSAYVGLLVRNSAGRVSIDADHLPSGEFGVVVEIPGSEVAVMRSLISRA